VKSDRGTIALCEGGGPVVVGVGTGPNTNRLAAMGDETKPPNDARQFSLLGSDAGFTCSPDRSWRTNLTASRNGYAWTGKRFG
jgi:hypothetical protein